MRKIICVMAAVMTAALLFSACSNGESNGETSGPAGESVSADAKESGADSTSKANSMILQGNPTTINLAEIAEESEDTYNAWIKISTIYDPELSMYSSDSVPEGATGIVVDFTVSGMDVDEATLYWCYELVSGGETLSVWDDTSPADKLTINGDGSYRMVFDAEKALGGTIDSICSLQIVFPGISETTTTSVTVDSAGYVDSSMNISDFQNEQE